MLNVSGETFKLDVFCLIFSRCSAETIFVPILVIFFSMFWREKAFFKLSTCGQKHVSLSDYLPVCRLNTRLPYLAFFKLDRFSFSALDFSMFSRSWGHTSSSSSSASSPTSSSDDSSIVLSSPAWEGLPSISAGSDSSKMSSLGNGGGSFTKTVAGISFSSWRTQEKSLSQLEKMDRCNSRWLEVYYVTAVSYITSEKTLYFDCIQIHRMLDGSDISVFYKSVL